MSPVFFGFLLFGIILSSIGFIALWWESRMDEITKKHIKEEKVHIRYIAIYKDTKGGVYSHYCLKESSQFIGTDAVVEFVFDKEYNLISTKVLSRRTTQT
jgi:hypothetical protein